MTRRFIYGVILLGIFFGVVYLCDVRLYAPSPTLWLQDSDGGYLCEVRDGGDDAEAGYWRCDPIPPRIAATVLAVEDHRFYRHPGVDPVAVVRAFLQNLNSGERISGASTIAMQVARLQNPARRTYWNKLREIMEAVVLTVRYGRRSILEQYLCLAPYGNGIRGLGFAAQAYFAKPVGDLSWAEIAFLCAIPQQPNGMNPRSPGGRVRCVKRARQILDTVRLRGMMTLQEYDRARAQVATLQLVKRRVKPLESIHVALRYEAMFREGQLAKTEQPLPWKVTSINPEYQRYISEQLQMCVDAWAVSGAVNGAVMVVDAETRQVVALVGSTDYLDDSRCGAIDYTAVKRSPGSTLKPFIYAHGLNTGLISSDSFIEDSLRFAGGFRNFDRWWLGGIPVSQALASSRNIPAVSLLKRAGLHGTYGCFSDLKLHDYQISAEKYGLGMAVGGLPVSMEMLVRAYTVFVARGRLGELRWFEDDAVSDFSDRQIFSEETVQTINGFLSDPMARLPSFPRMGNLEYEYPVAVKTGTSEGNRDAWTVAWSNKYLLAVWLGRPDGGMMRRVSGYRAAAELAHGIMDYLHEDISNTGAVSKPFSKVKRTGLDIPEITKQSDRGQLSMLRIISPEDGATYYFDPEIPQELASLCFSGECPGASEMTVTWEVDGYPYKTGVISETVRWLLKPGEHRIRLRSAADPGLFSEVSIRVASPRK